MDNLLPLVTDQSQSAVAPKPSKIRTLSEPLPPGMSPGSHCSTTDHSGCRERVSVRGLGAENPQVRPPRPVRDVVVGRDVMWPRFVRSTWQPSSTGR